MRPPMLLAGVAILSSCATAPTKPKQNSDLKLIYRKVCSVGGGVSAVKGSIWMKAKSSEASGQFPALVRAEAPDRLNLEVTNVVGGTEAIITVQKGQYKIQGATGKIRTETGYGSWGGIPLHWAPELFLGRVPCPDVPELNRLKFSMSKDNVFFVETDASLTGEAERYVYRLRSWAGDFWPESLHWERSGPFSAAVDFSFEDPEDYTGSPRKWEVRSSKGEVKVRWRDRDVSRQ